MKRGLKPYLHDADTGRGVKRGTEERRGAGLREKGASYAGIFTGYFNKSARYEYRIISLAPFPARLSLYPSPPPSWPPRLN